MEIADVLEAYASFRELILVVAHCITQTNTQPSQTCSGGFINALFFILLFVDVSFAIGEYYLI
jgi:hypothetical protein